MKWLTRDRRLVDRFKGDRRKTGPQLPPDQLAAAWQAVSLLLDYPTEQLISMLPAIRDAARELPRPVAEPLERVVAYLRDGDLQQIQSDYVATFDTTRRCALHLTYFAYGDTRKRGVALVQFKQAYRKAGLIVTEDELPDHLSVVCEFGATGDAEVAWKLLNNHRSGIELLRLALDEKNSPWLGAVEALTATMPELEGDQIQAVARLIEQGPPDEEVGLDAYSLDPQLNPQPFDDNLYSDPAPGGSGGANFVPLSDVRVSSSTGVQA